MRTFLAVFSALTLAMAIPQNAPAYAGDGKGGVQGGTYGQAGQYGGGQYSRGQYGGGQYGGGGEEPLCQGLAGNPQCCQLNALGLAALPCDPPHESPWNKQSFYQTCAASGRSAQCCVLPAAGAGLLCNQP